MAGISHTGRLGSDQFTRGKEFPRIDGAFGIRAAHLLSRASLVALGCSILVQPAMAQSAVPAQSKDQSAASAGQSEDGDITVTGSRVITDNLNSPTPITTADVAELAKTTPSDTRRRAEQASADHRRPNPPHARQWQHQQRRQCAFAAQLRPLAHPGAAGWASRAGLEPGRHRQHRYPAADAGEPGRHRHRRRLGGLRFRRGRRRGQFHSRQEIHRIVGEGRRRRFPSTAMERNGSSARPGAPICSGGAAISRRPRGIATRR